jgi:hypothetical protein
MRNQIMTIDLNPEEGLDALFNRPAQPVPDTDNLDLLFGGGPRCKDCNGTGEIRDFNNGMIRPCLTCNDKPAPRPELPEKWQAAIGYMQAIITYIEDGNADHMSNAQRALSDTAAALAALEDELSVHDRAALIEDGEDEWDDGENEEDEDEEVPFDDDDSSMTLCLKCGGAGAFENGTRLCEQCDGTGWVDMDEMDDESEAAS